jgi:hypothetical protein
MAFVVGFQGVTLLHADLIAPGVPIAGQSQFHHAHAWWETMVNLPGPVNPIFDATGAHTLRAQVGSVLYLPGSFGPSSNRSITVNPGTTIFLPLVNTLGDNVAPIGDPPFTFTAHELFDIYGLPPAGVVNLFLEVDGQPVGNTATLLNHRQTTDPNNPATIVYRTLDNLYTDPFGFDPTFGTGVYPALVFPSIVDGYWVGLNPFTTVGPHTIHFGATVNHPFFGTIIQDNFFTITVAPEPGSVLVWGLVASLGVIGAWRGRNAKRARVGASP